MGEGEWGQRGWAGGCCRRQENEGRLQKATGEPRLKVDGKWPPQSWAQPLHPELWADPLRALSLLVTGVTSLDGLSSFGDTGLGGTEPQSLQQ